MKLYQIFRMLIILFFVILSNSVFAQNIVQEKLLIQGKIIDESNGHPMPFTHVLNTRINSGTISGDKGYFGLNNIQLNDTLVVSFIGYQDKYHIVRNNAFVEIVLSPSQTKLNELILISKESDRLYQIISSAKTSTVKGQSKAYFQLKTKKDGNQIELIENFYNSNIDGYDLDKLDLKVGRLGLKPKDHRIFTNISSSKALLRHKLFLSDKRTFYSSPFHYNFKQLKKKFELEYISETIIDSNTIWAIQFTPKQDGLFNGMVWIDIDNYNIHKIELNCKSCETHPFRPLFPEDSIKSIDLNITKSFSLKGTEMIVNQIKFDYDILYSRENDNMSNINSSVLLQLYDFNSTFIEPKMIGFNHSDYQMISNTPYNSFFWEKHNELQIFDYKNENEKYYNSDETVTNVDLFNNNEILKTSLFSKQFFKSPNFEWSKKRIIMKSKKTKETLLDNFSSGGPAVKTKLEFRKDQYHLSTYLYLDINTYEDSLNVVLKTFINGYESFYDMVLTPEVHMFINIFFDITEIKRQELNTILSKGNLSETQILSQFNIKNTELKNMQDEYLKTVRRGENEEALIEWNAYVFEKLGIDNMLLLEGIGEIVK